MNQPGEEPVNIHQIRSVLLAYYQWIMSLTPSQIIKIGNMPDEVRVNEFIDFLQGGQD